MKTKTISVSKKNINYIPNLANYDKVYSSFNFQKNREEYESKQIFNSAYYISDQNAASWRKNKVALYWISETGIKKKFTFSDINLLANKTANFLKAIGVSKGDRVFIFLPRVPEIYYSFIAILKLGAIAGVMFPAFGEEALLDRLQNSGAKVLITNKILAPRVMKIKSKLPDLKKIIIADNFENEVENYSPVFETRQLNETDPMFMLYTSSTGNTPVCGIVIPHKAIIQQIWTAKVVLDLKEDDTLWCTADPGWVTGLVYGLIAPWSLGITIVVHEGRFDPKTWYQTIQNYKISVLYSAPTAFRMLAQYDNTHKKYDLKSVRHILSVGEALTPASISWARHVFNLPIHDTYWQTETGSIMIANFPSLPIRQGSMGKAVPGIKAAIVDDSLTKLSANKEGNLAFIKGWPSMMTNVWKNKKRYESYFKGKWFFTGDRAYKDKDDYFWFVGRADDVIKTAGERVGPFEVEAALQDHPKVIEAGVIGVPDKLRGEIIKAFIVLKKNVKGDEKLKENIMKFIKTRLAGHAYPREIKFVAELPKNRSGKIIRRILKAKELGLPLGDTSTLIT